LLVVSFGLIWRKEGRTRRFRGVHLCALLFLPPQGLAQPTLRNNCPGSPLADPGADEKKTKQINDSTLSV
jgi:hypothetical protein